MEGKILSSGERICLFCGQPLKESYEEYEKYYYCDCEDAVETRRIESKIYELKRQFPRPKYEIINKNVLYSKK